MHKCHLLYVLADCSGSMHGAPIESMESFIRELHYDLMGDPQSVEGALLSVITSNFKGIDVFPLKDVAEFIPPKLRAAGNSAFGAALNVLKDRIDSEEAMTNPEWKPIVFLLTGGTVIDDWVVAAEKLKQNEKCWFICIHCGAGDPPSELKRVSECVLCRRDMTPDYFLGRNFFPWHDVEAEIGE